MKLGEECDGGVVAVPNSDIATWYQNFQEAGITAGLLMNKNYIRGLIEPWRYLW
jgi:hypothetical protein